MFTRLRYGEHGIEKCSLCLARSCNYQIPFIVWTKDNLEAQIITSWDNQVVWSFCVSEYYRSRTWSWKKAVALWEDERNALKFIFIQRRVHEYLLKQYMYSCQNLEKMYPLDRWIKHTRKKKHYQEDSTSTNFKMWENKKREIIKKKYLKNSQIDILKDSLLKLITWWEH